MIGTQAEYARHAGISKQAVGKAVKRGQIPLRPDGKVDFESADLARSRNLNPARDLAASDRKSVGGDQGDPPASPPEQAGLSFNDARTAREAFQAKLSKLEYERKIGELISRQEVADALVTAGRAIRNKLDALPNMADELVAIVAAGGGARDVRQAIVERVTALEQSIAETLAKLGGEDDDG